MNRTAKYPTKKFGAPVIGDSMILYKAVWLTPNGKLFGSWDSTYEYKIGKAAKPMNGWCAPARSGVCASGMHVGSMDFAQQWRKNEYVPPRTKNKLVILACQVKVADMVATDLGAKVRCKEILPIGIVQE